MQNLFNHVRLDPRLFNSCDTGGDTGLSTSMRQIADKEALIQEIIDSGAFNTVDNLDDARNFLRFDLQNPKSASFSMTAADGHCFHFELNAWDRSRFFSKFSGFREDQDRTAFEGGPLRPSSENKYFDISIREDNNNERCFGYFHFTVQNKRCSSSSGYQGTANGKIYHDLNIAEGYTFRRIGSAAVLLAMYLGKVNGVSEFAVYEPKSYPFFARLGFTRKTNGCTIFNYLTSPLPPLPALERAICSEIGSFGCLGKQAFTTVRFDTACREKAMNAFSQLLPPGIEFSLPSGESYRMFYKLENQRETINVCNCQKPEQVLAKIPIEFGNARPGGNALVIFNYWPTKDLVDTYNIQDIRRLFFHITDKLKELSKAPQSCILAPTEKFLRFTSVPDKPSSVCIDDASFQTDQWKLKLLRISSYGAIYTSYGAPFYYHSGAEAEKD